MAQYETVQSASVGTSQAGLDAGLREYMSRVYGLMAIGMAVTGAVAWGVGTNEALLQAIFATPLKWVVMFAPLAVVMVFGATLHRMSVTTAQAVFYGFSALMGLSISYIFAVYTGMSIATTFATTSAAFAGLSLYGYVTKRDLSGFGTFLMMGVWGLVIASIINIFLQSSAVQFAVSLLGVLIFAGLTAFDTQKIKNTYLQMAQSGDQDSLGKSAIMGALTLYLDFLNLFMFLLQFMGDRR